MNFDFFMNIPIYLISLYGAVSHIILFISFIKDPLECFRNSGTYFVAQLALSDFLVCLSKMIILNCSTPHSGYMVELITIFPAGLSFGMIVSISIDRFLIVTYPLKHRFFMEKKVIIIWLLVIWLISSIYPTKLAIVGRTTSEDETSQRILALIAILLTATLYTLTLFELKKQSLQMALCNATSSENRAQRKRLLKEKQFLWTIILIASITLICILPNMVWRAVDPQSNFRQQFDSKTTTILTSLMNIVYMVNFAINPCIYFIRLPNYRRTFKLLFCGYI